MVSAYCCGSSLCSSDERKEEERQDLLVQARLDRIGLKALEIGRNLQMHKAVGQRRGHIKDRGAILLAVATAQINQPSWHDIGITRRSRISCWAMPCMAGGAMLSSSRNRIPAPSRGRNSGGYQRETPFSGTGRPRRSVTPAARAADRSSPSHATAPSARRCSICRSPAAPDHGAEHQPVLDQAAQVVHQRLWVHVRSS